MILLWKDAQKRKIVHYIIRGGYWPYFSIKWLYKICGHMKHQCFLRSGKIIIRYQLKMIQSDNMPESLFTINYNWVQQRSPVVYFNICMTFSPNNIDVIWSYRKHMPHLIKTYQRWKFGGKFWLQFSSSINEVSLNLNHFVISFIWITRILSKLYVEAEIDSAFHFILQLKNPR